MKAPLAPVCWALAWFRSWSLRGMRCLRGVFQRAHLRHIVKFDLRISLVHARHSAVGNTANRANPASFYTTENLVTPSCGSVDPRIERRGVGLMSRSPIWQQEPRRIIAAEREGARGQRSAQPRNSCEVTRYSAVASLPAHIRSTASATRASDRQCPHAAANGYSQGNRRVPGS